MQQSHEEIEILISRDIKQASKHPSPQLGLQKTGVRNMGISGTAITIDIFSQNFTMHRVCQEPPSP